MFAPAGYFWTACPSVIIDEGIIRQGISAQFTYPGVLGLDHEGEQRPDILQTWNGEKTVYIFDENQSYGIDHHRALAVSARREAQTAI